MNETTPLFLRLTRVDPIDAETTYLTIIPLAEITSINAHTMDRTLKAEDRSKCGSIVTLRDGQHVMVTQTVEQIDYTLRGPCRILSVELAPQRERL